VDRAFFKGGLSLHLTYLVDIIAAAGQRFFALPFLDDTVGLITKNDIKKTKWSYFCSGWSIL